jgi:hypothetical protein
LPPAFESKTGKRANTDKVFVDYNNNKKLFFQQTIKEHFNEISKEFKTFNFVA